MKKIVLLALVVLLVMSGTASAQRASSLDPGIGDILGQKGLQNEGNKIFYMVHNVQTTDTTTTITATIADSIVIWDTTLDDGVSVTTTTTSHDSRVAGILTQTTLTFEEGTSSNTAAQNRGRANWGWLQVYGASQVRLDNTVEVGVGDALGTGEVAGEGSSFLPSVNDPALNGFAGFFLDASTAASNDVEVFLRCM